MLVSFVIPAHNEERHVGAAVHAVRDAATACGVPFEVIVVDDSSTDATARIAASAGARVIRVEHRQISATRNAGARAARGDVLFFVDADTLANSAAVRAALRELSRGAVGGGCVFKFDGVIPLWARTAYPITVAFARGLKIVGGCFLFCTRAAFDAAGGFDERLFAAEEILFIRALKQEGRFAIPRPVVVTSGRKLRVHAVSEILLLAWRWLRYGQRSVQSREGLDIWYAPRMDDAVVPAKPEA